MTPFEAIMIAEGASSAKNEEEYIAAWQFLIDTGTCWELQGWFGRTAAHMIEQGLCSVPASESKEVDPEYCDCCECTPCDCDWGN